MIYNHHLPDFTCGACVDGCVQGGTCGRVWSSRRPGRCGWKRCWSREMRPRAGTTPPRCTHTHMHATHTRTHPPTHSHTHGRTPRTWLFRDSENACSALALRGSWRAGGRECADRPMWGRLPGNGMGCVMVGALGSQLLHGEPQPAPLPPGIPCKIAGHPCGLPQIACDGRGKGRGHSPGRVGGLEHLEPAGAEPGYNDHGEVLLPRRRVCSAVGAAPGNLSVARAV